MVEIPRIVLPLGGCKKLMAALLLGTAVLAGQAGDPLSDGFRTPPREARAHTWWHWMNGNVSKAGITADLEAMARVGLGGVQLFDAGLALPAGPVAFDTPAWYEHVAFAAREAERLGLSFGIANCSGWTSSGGPWITPALSMKVVTSSRLETRGPRWLETRLEAPKDTHGFYADIAVVAFPTPVSRAEIPDFAHQVFRLRGDERGPVGVDPIPDDAILANACVDPARLVDVTTNLAADGTFRWEVPSGDWTVLRVGYRANGQRNRPATAHGSGLECDKLSARALDVHFDAYVGKVAAALKGSRSFDNVLIDSYEVKGQNWTDGFEREFRARVGYDITPYLPVLANVPVGSAAETRRFLADFRRVVSALFCENYAGRMAKRCHALGVKFACEPYGNGPFNDLAYGERCDIPMAEFWTQRGDGVSMWTRWGHRWRGNARVVASTAHYWGKPIVGAEAFTAYPTATSGRWLEHPASMKAQGDMILADGVNRFYFHRYAHQPWTSPDRFPGMTMAFYGSHLERTQTWWENGFKAYLAYLSRAQYLLSRGTFVADALITVGDEAPNFGTDGETPEGWRSDHCTAAALAKLRREGAAFVSPGGVRYRVVAKPGDDIGAKLAAAGCPKDFICVDRNVSWIHRRDGEDEIYFVATAATAPTRVRCSFRDAAGEPELWNPETGEIEKATCRRADGRAELDLAFGPADSVFVVFRRQPTASARLVRRPAASPTCVRTLDGPWRVSFAAPGSKTPFERRFAALADWTKSEDEEIRYFSGTATYEMTVALAERPSGGRRVLLDLGDVKDIAEVFVDGRPVRTLWKPPFVVDITEVAGARPFRLSVKVTNRWPNRLIGDERQHRAVGTWNADNKWKRPVIGDLPAWLTTGGANPSGASTFATCRLWRADDELLPSGLLGPVRFLVEAPTFVDEWDYLKRKWREDVSDPSTGLAAPALRAEIEKAMPKWKAELPWPDAKAKAFAFLCDRTAIDVSPHDWFPTFAYWTRHTFKLHPFWDQVGIRKGEVFAKWKFADHPYRKYWRGYPDFDHSAPDWDDILKLGFPGMAERLKANWKATGYYPPRQVAIDGVMRLLDRFIACGEGKVKALNGSGPAERGRLAKQVESLKRLRAGAPQTAYDALNFIYLYWVISENFEGIQVRTLGNLDRLVAPYYRADLAAGRTTEEEFRSQLRHFWWQWGSIDNYYGQPVYFGGTKADGTTEYNEVSKIMLDVHDELALATPKLHLKVGKSTPDWVWRKTIDMARRMRPISFIGEEPHARVIKSMGYTDDEAREFMVWGCYEWAIRDSANDTFGASVNLPKTIETLLADAAAGRFAPADYAAFKDACRKLVSSVVADARAFALEDERDLAAVNPSLLFSLATRHSVETGKDAFCGGMLHGNNTGIWMVGLASTIDSIAAVKELVYDRREMSLADLGRIMAANWKGHEPLRLRMVRSKRKWGNNDPDTNAIARELSGWIAKEVNGHANARGGRFKVHGHTARWHYGYGADVGATPDGRRKGEEISKNISPVMGADTEGVTALVASAANLDARDLPGDFPLDVALLPNTVAGEKGIDMMRTVIDIYFANGGLVIQFNVHDAATLRDAQKHPERYANLQVRVTGWNVRWNDIPKAEQDKFIQRAENIVQ